MNEYLKEQVFEIVCGSYDLHVHTAPSHRQRSLDDFELAHELDRYKMAGAIIKSHFDLTAGRAAVANQHSGAKAKLYGAVTLNLPAGGLNPYAVESAIELGAKMVWLPTVDIKRGLRVTDDTGKLLPEMFQIFEIVKKHGVCLATGHIKPAESLIVCQEGIQHGVKMILTHPDAKNMTMPLEDQVNLAHKGVMIEKTWGNVYNGFISADAMAVSIQAIGAECVFLASDFGQANHPLPTEGICDFVAELLSRGFSQTSLVSMVRTNPSRILGVSVC